MILKVQKNLFPPMKRLSRVIFVAFSGLLEPFYFTTHHKKDMNMSTNAEMFHSNPQIETLQCYYKSVPKPSVTLEIIYAMIVTKLQSNKVKTFDFKPKMTASQMRQFSFPSFLSPYSWQCQSRTRKFSQTDIHLLDWIEF